MKKRMIPITLLFIFALNCTRNVTQPLLRNPTRSTSRLHSFFSMCERDIHNAAAVIAERELIKNLTHLHRMNAGGKKYYILERENITEMIRSVTEGVYSDYILINRNGTVIYTRENDDLFGKKVTTSLIDSPLDHCFKMSGNLMHIEDVTDFPKKSGQYNLFISKEVKREGSIHGIFVLQVNTAKIEGVLGLQSMVMDNNGITRVSVDKKDMLYPNRFYSQFEKDGIENGKVIEFKSGSDGFSARQFSYKNLKWIVLDKK